MTPWIAMSAFGGKADIARHPRAGHFGRVEFPIGLGEYINMGSEPAPDNLLQTRRAAVLQRSFGVLFFLLASLTIATEPSGAEITICGGIPEAIDTSLSGEPFANLELGGRRGFFLIDTGGTDSLVDMQRYGRSVAAKISLTGFSIPSVWDGIFTAADLHSFSNPAGGGELGVVGTDLLSRLSIEFHYEQPHPFAAFAMQACDEATLQRAGTIRPIGAN